MAFMPAAFLSDQFKYAPGVAAVYINFEVCAVAEPHSDAVVVGVYGVGVTHMKRNGQRLCCKHNNAVSTSIAVRKQPAKVPGVASVICEKNGIA